MAADHLILVGLGPRLIERLRLRRALCSSQTVASAKSANCRYSDCQFSITAWPKLEELR